MEKLSPVALDLSQPITVTVKGPDLVGVRLGEPEVTVGTKGDHVAPARAALKTFLQRLNEPKQPDDAAFDVLVKGPFTAPPKKKTNDRRF